MECVNQFEVDAEGHGMMVEVLVVRADVLQCTRILVVAPVHEAHVLAFVELGIATGTLLLDGFFETESILIHREYSCMAYRLVGYCCLLLHYELQGDVVDGLLEHNEIRILFL